MFFKKCKNYKNKDVELKDVSFDEENKVKDNGLKRLFKKCKGCKNKDDELKDISFKEDYKDLTREEVEALAASKAADLREKDKKLMEDQEKEKKKEEKNKKVRRFLEFAAIILFILLLLARCSVLPVPEPIKEIIDIGFEDTVDTDDIVYEDDEEPYDSRYSMLTMSMNKVPVFENGLAKGNLNIENDPRNVYAQYIEIYLDDAEGNPETLIYKSNLIDIGQTLLEDALDVNLPAGEYPCTAYFNAVLVKKNEAGNILEQSYAGKGGAKITITILNTVESPAETQVED